MSKYTDDLTIPDFLDRNRNKQGEAASGPSGGAAFPVVPGGPSGTSLQIFEDAKRRLAEAKTVDEVNKIHAMAIGLVEYAKQASDRQLEADATAIRMEAERRLGELMRQQKETVGLNEGGRPKTGVCETPVSERPPTLAEAGIDKNLAKKARAAAALSEEEFQAQVAAKRETARTRTGKSLAVEARATTQRARRRKPKPSYLEKLLSNISAACKRGGEKELPSDLGVAEIDSAIAIVKAAIGELNKLIDRLDEARLHAAGEGNRYD